MPRKKIEILKIKERDYVPNKFTGKAIYTAGILKGSWEYYLGGELHRIGGPAQKDAYMGTIEHRWVLFGIDYGDDEAGYWRMLFKMCQAIPELQKAMPKAMAKILELSDDNE